jgi:hypothetical protein
MQQGIQQGMQQGIQQGMQQGIQQGMQQGIQQGMQQGIQQGMQQGIQQERLSGIELGLELKFGVEGLRLLPEISKIEDADVLRAIRAGLKVINTPAELRRIYRKDPPDPAATNDSPAQTREAASPYTAQTPAEALPEDDDQEDTPDQ